MNGEGVSEDDAEAARWYRMAAEQGDAGAQYNLGVRYANGEGVPEDDAEAARWYRMAAEQGDADAQYNLGVRYATGEGVPEDDAEAVRWYRMAAEQGDARAQLSLGIRYANGEGVPEDDAEAVRWYRMAAEQGRRRRAVQPWGHVRHRQRRPQGRYASAHVAQHRGCQWVRNRQGMAGHNRRRHDRHPDRACNGTGPHVHGLGLREL